VPRLIAYHRYMTGGYAPVIGKLSWAIGGRHFAVKRGIQSVRVNNTEVWGVCFKNSVSVNGNIQAQAYRVLRSRVVLP
jgi:hypothetical protein